MFRMNREESDNDLREILIQDDANDEKKSVITLRVLQYARDDLCQVLARQSKSSCRKFVAKASGETLGVLFQIFFIYLTISSLLEYSDLQNRLKNDWISELNETCAARYGLVRHCSRKKSSFIIEPCASEYKQSCSDISYGFLGLFFTLLCCCWNLVLFRTLRDCRAAPLPTVLDIPRRKRVSLLTLVNRLKIPTVAGEIYKISYLLQEINKIIKYQYDAEQKRLNVLFSLRKQSPSSAKLRFYQIGSGKKEIMNEIFEYAAIPKLNSYR